MLIMTRKSRALIVVWRIMATKPYLKKLYFTIYKKKEVCYKQIIK